MGDPVIVNDGGGGGGGWAIALIVGVLALIGVVFLFNSGALRSGGGSDGNIDVTVDVPKVEAPKVDAPAPAAPAPAPSTNGGG